MLLRCRYAHLTNALVVDGTPIGHLLHPAGAALAAAAVFGVLYAVQQASARRSSRVVQARVVLPSRW